MNQVMQEVQQMERQRQQINQRQIQETINTLESQGLDVAACLTSVRLPDYSSQPGTEYFHKALEGINKMLTGESPLSLKDAVFMVENAYLDNKLSYTDFNDYIQEAAGLCQAKMKELKLDTQDPLAKSMVLFYFIYDRHLYIETGW